MDKICTSCGKGKRVHHRTICKDCLNNQKLDWFKKKKDGYHYVYIIENDKYAGVTDSLYARKNNHKRDKRDIESLRVIYKTKDREDAEELEELLHDIGYNGRHSYNAIK